MDVMSGGGQPGRQESGVSSKWSEGCEWESREGNLSNAEGIEGAREPIQRLRSFNREALFKDGY